MKREDRGNIALNDYNSFNRCRPLFVFLPPYFIISGPGDGQANDSAGSLCQERISIIFKIVGIPGTLMTLDLLSPSQPLSKLKVPNPELPTFFGTSQSSNRETRPFFT